MKAYVLIILTVVAFSCNKEIDEGYNVDLSPDNIDIQDYDEQTGWYRTRLDDPDVWGFLDKDSVIRIPFIYKYINPFDSMNMTYGQIGEKYGFIDINNDTLIPFIYDELRAFNHGLSRAVKEGKHGFLDRHGETVLPFIYDDAHGFIECGIAKVNICDKWGFIDTKGNAVVSIDFESVDYNFEDTVVVVEKDAKYGIFSYDGEQLTGFEFTKVHESYLRSGSFNSTYNQNGLILVERDGQFGYLDSDCEIRIPYGKYMIARPFNMNGLAVVGNSNGHGIINIKGEFVYPFGFQMINHPNRYSSISNVFVVEKDGKYGLLDYNANPLNKIDNLSIEWDYVRNSNNRHGYYIIQNAEGLYGIINGIGEIQIPFEYTGLEPFDGDSLTIAKKDGYYGIISHENKVIRAFDCEEIYRERSFDYYIISSNGKYGMIDKSNHVILPVEYEELTPCFYDRNHRFIAKKEGKKGIITEEQNIIIPFEYDIISNWVEYGPNAHFVIKDGKYGLISREGKVVIPTEYEQMFVEHGFPLIKVKNDSLWGTVNWNNEIVHPIEYEQIFWDSSFDTMDKVDTVYVQRDGRYFATDLEGKVLDENVSDEIIEKKFGYLFRNYDDVEMIESNIPNYEIEGIDL